MKLCECGCGQPAPIATYTRSDRGYVKGQPQKFIRGHYPCSLSHGHDAINLRGRTFGRLTVKSRSKNSAGGKARWSCVCACGHRVTVHASDLISGHTVSCGCLRNKAASLRLLKHAHAKTGQRTPEYNSWRGMLQRALNHGGKSPSYANVDVCDRWNPEAGGPFENFLADLGFRPKGTSLGRYADLSSYAPGECCWMSPAEQALEKRNKRALLKWAAREVAPAAQLAA
jgi:hypothetical protein